MKKIFLVLVLLGIFLPIKVLAFENSFYEGEYVPGAYIKKFKDGRGKYEQIRVFRRNGDNQFVYCTQLWEGMRSNVNLTGYVSDYEKLSNVSYDDWNKIVLLAYYGYNYENHTDIKWYAVTQYMIWQIIEKNTNFYFTDTLNGNKVEKYKEEIEELNLLIKEHYNTPNFRRYVAIAPNKTLTLTSSNDEARKFIVTASKGIRIDKKTNNSITFTPTLEGEGSILFSKNAKLYTNRPYLYVDNNGQNLLAPGVFPSVIYSVILLMPKADFTINKIDYDTNSSISLGEASLEGTEFTLYNSKHEYVTTVKTDSSGRAIFKDLYYDKYYIKEVKAGNGYVLNDKEFEIEVGDEGNNLTVSNQVIKNKIVINKYIKTKEGHIENEEASFIILDSNNKEILNFDTIDGYYETILPFGKYQVKQITGREGYKFIDDFTISVEEEKTQEFNLYNEEIVIESIDDYDKSSKLILLNEKKMELNEESTFEVITDVPNTYTSNNYDVLLIVLVGLGIILIKKDIIYENK